MDLSCDFERSSRVVHPYHRFQSEQVQCQLAGRAGAASVIQNMTRALTECAQAAGKPCDSAMSEVIFFFTRDRQSLSQGSVIVGRELVEIRWRCHSQRVLVS